MNLEFNDVAKALAELNGCVKLDNNTMDKQEYFGGNENRTGVFYKSDHICNIQRGSIPEFNTFGDYNKVLMPVSPEVGLRPENYSTVVTRQFLLTEEDITIQEANLNLGTRKSGVIMFGGHQVMAERKNAQLTDGRIVAAILFRAYLKPVVLPHKIDRMGWRETFAHILKANIPGITGKTLGEKLNVDLINRKNVSIQSIEDLKKKAVE